MENKPTLITLPEALKEEMKQYAAELNISLAQLIQFALIHYKASKKNPKLK